MYEPWPRKMYLAIKWAMPATITQKIKVAIIIAKIMLTNTILIKEEENMPPVRGLRALVTAETIL
jgi:hypothetical protein